LTSPAGNAVPAAADTTTTGNWQKKTPSNSARNIEGVFIKRLRGVAQVKVPSWQK